MKLLILMSDTGGGHRSVAEAVTAAIEQLDPSSTIEFLDFFSICAPFPFNQAGKVYGPWVNYAATLWSAGFHLTNGRRRASLLQSLISRITRQCVVTRVRAFQPDVIATVHPLATRLALDVRQKTRDGAFPIATIVTDLVTAHASWFSGNPDLITVPSDAVRLQALRAGIPEDKIRLTGQPVHPKFIDVCTDREVTRLSLGLGPDRFTVLLIGGGEGMGRLAEMARAVDTAGLDLQQIVICGRNEPLRRELQQTSWHIPTCVIGFTHDMPALMHAADVIVTKAGPSTICEALSLGRPLLLTGSVPGQEQGNIDFVTEAGAGRLTNTPQALTGVLRNLLNSSADAHSQMVRNARRLARPAAATDVAEILLNLAHH